MDWDFTFRATQAIGTVLLGAGALAIAILKWRDDREKIKNELWADRFDIYQIAIESQQKMISGGVENWNDEQNKKKRL